MKIQIKPGRVIRLTPTANSSSRGGVVDLKKLGLSDPEMAEILKLDGVSEVKSPKAPAKGGDS